MEKISLEPLFNEQKKLDEKIALSHGVSYETTKNERALALLVEIAEFANATRCFKYWSLKKADDIKIILEEYADGLHFFLSLGLSINTTKNEYVIRHLKKDLTSQILRVYDLVNLFIKKRDEKHFVKAFGAYLNLIPSFNGTWEEVKKAYFVKLKENYRRQENRY